MYSYNCAGSFFPKFSCRLKFRSFSWVLIFFSSDLLLVNFSSFWVDRLLPNRYVPSRLPWGYLTYLFVPSERADPIEMKRILLKQFPIFHTKMSVTVFLELNVRLWDEYFFVLFFQILFSTSLNFPMICWRLLISFLRYFDDFFLPFVYG